MHLSSFRKSFVAQSDLYLNHRHNPSAAAWGYVLCYVILHKSHRLEFEPTTSRLHFTHKSHIVLIPMSTIPSSFHLNMRRATSSRSVILICSCKVEVPHLIPPRKPTLRKTMAKKNRRPVAHFHIVDRHPWLKKIRTHFINSTLPVNDHKRWDLDYLNIHMAMGDVFRITKGWLEIIGDLLKRAEVNVIY